MAAQHWSLGPSKAKQWINCPGSIALSARAPKGAPSQYAAEGTVAHGVLEDYVTGKVDYLSMVARIGTFVKQDGFDIEITEEMIDAAVEYHDLIAEDRKALEADGAGKRTLAVQGHAEVVVHAKSVHEAAKGTADYILYRKGRKLIVYDFKFGQGVMVEPEENEQGALYLLGAMETIAGAAFDELEIVIYQPRASHADGGIRRWTVPKAWLEQFRATAAAAAVETQKPNAKLAAGDWCRWCAAKPFCPELHNKAQASAAMDFEAVAPMTPAKAEERLPEVRLMPIEKLARMLEWEGTVKALFEAVKDVVREKLSAGEIVPGWKLVEGRAHRRWVNEDEVVAAFAPVLGEEKLYAPRKLISPAALEKILGKKTPVDHLTYKPEAPKSVARDTDRRPAASPAAQDAFAAIPAPVAALACSDCDLGMCDAHVAQATPLPLKKAPIWPV